MPELFDMELRAMRRDRAARTGVELFLFEGSRNLSHVILPAPGTRFSPFAKSFRVQLLRLGDWRDRFGRARLPDMIA